MKDYSTLAKDEMRELQSKTMPIPDIDDSPGMVKMIQDELFKRLKAKEEIIVAQHKTIEFLLGKKNGS
jgi:hypothetical protein